MIYQIQRTSMNTLKAVMTVFAVSIVFFAMSAQDTMARGVPDGFADLVERLAPSVVNVSTSQKVDVAEKPNFQMPDLPEDSPFAPFFKDFFDRQHGNRGPQKVRSQGSGFVIDEDGLIITNNHVIKDADEIKVTFADGSSLEAELVGADSKKDLAVLRVKSDEKLQAVDWGDSDTARVGDWVVAIGNPFGLGGTVTAGIVSAFNRNINAGPYDDFIQTDASINRGNSGGPLFDLNGKVIGINTAIFSPDGGSIGLGFSIPSKSARPTIDQLIEYGETRRGWLGVSIKEVTEDMALALELPDASGAFVQQVFEGGPADKAGIEGGDVIVGFDDQKVEQSRDLVQMTGDRLDGETVTLEVVRKGDKKTIDVLLGRREVAEKELSNTELAGAEGEQDPATVEFDELGLKLGNITDEARQALGLDEDATGVLVAAVEQDSEAQEKGMQRGDLIVEVAQEPVNSIEDVERLIEQARDKSRKAVLFTTRKGKVNSSIALRLDKQ